MTTNDSPFVAAVDWGTSSFRLWLLTQDGEVLGERRSREGMQSAGGTGFAAVLESHLAAVRAPDGLPVIVCGMAGARQGWIEAPYVDAPADLSQIAAAAIQVPGGTRDVRILPGVAQGRPSVAGDGADPRPDVMRGEETQAMGLARAGRALLCMPGTHSKWVDLSAGSITGFSTFMTGETFALFSEQSILRHAVHPTSEVSEQPEAFAAGVADALAAPAAIFNRLFSLRAEGLFGQGSPQEARSRLSGLLIGLEIAGAKAMHPDGAATVLVASGPLRDLYRAAFDVAGHAFEEADAETAVRGGLLAAAHDCFGTEERASS